MVDLTEFNKLEQLLVGNNFIYDRFDDVERHILSVYETSWHLEHDKRSWDAAISPYTQGSSEGLLEICGDIVEKKYPDSDYYDEVEGYLSATDVLEKALSINRTESIIKGATFYTDDGKVFRGTLKIKDLDRGTKNE